MVSFNIGWRNNMPLKKSASKKAFKENVSKETKVFASKGKSPAKASKQAVAVAFAEKRAAAKKPKAKSKK
jgi:hypothetical protein